ncbi:MAG: hypothetical protein MZV70_05140 [Desulfobacterales bacterium]|nr:hypothetical protein [Desulfobacterales bacterium]
MMQPHGGRAPGLPLPAGVRDQPAQEVQRRSPPGPQPRASDIELAPIDEAEFLAFVGIGQKSKLHLSKFIHDKVMKALQARVAALGRELAGRPRDRRREITEWVELH